MCAILTLIPSASISAFFTLSAYINLFLAVFNLIPAFPMDGGRIFRSFLARKMSYARATRVAAETGKMLAVMMGIFGIFYSPWLILIAFFIYIGANEEEKLVMLEKLLGKYRVSDIMTTEVITVNPSTKVGELIELMLKKRHLGYPVVEDGKIVGIVTLQDVINVNPEVEVREVMTREIVTISPSESAFQALKLMNERRIGRLPVVENGKLVGIISRSDLMRVAEILETLEVLGWKSPKSV
jgi:CBS domain-containing protein